MNVEPWHTFRTGDHGQVVAGIQYLLRAQGHAVSVDESFGPLTAAAVRQVQQAHGLTQDGVVGRRTWPRLVVSVRNGSTGDAVRAVQQFGLLRFPGDPALTVDGAFGPRTQERVRFFQESWGLTTDGVAGRETWSFLGASDPDLWPLVKVGARQDDNWRVRAAQHLLKAHGAGIAADGVFGPASGAATRAFQETHRDTELSTTVGQLDWPDLIVTVRPGDHGQAVRAVQTLFSGLAVDGSFGPLTEAAVRDRQSVFVPPDDGIVGPVTWHLLTVRVFD